MALQPLKLITMATTMQNRNEPWLASPQRSSEHHFAQLHQQFSDEDILARTIGGCFPTADREEKEAVSCMIMNRARLVR